MALQALRSSGIHTSWRPSAPRAADRPTEPLVMGTESLVRKDKGKCPKLLPECEPSLVPPVALTQLAPDGSARARSPSPLAPPPMLGCSVPTELQQTRDLVILEVQNSLPLGTETMALSHGHSRGISLQSWYAPPWSSKGSDSESDGLLSTPPRPHMGPNTNRVQECTTRWHC